MNFDNLILLGFMFLFSVSIAAFGETQKKQNILSEKYPAHKLEELILSAENWHPYPTASERAGWDKISVKMRSAQIKRAEKLLNCEWETPKASVFLEFVRNGNRSNYQQISFGRRVNLTELVIGECLENQGRFLDDIVNGIWAICEESYWGVPAHLGLQEKGPGLPDVTEPTVDLFAAETGMLLSWTYYLLGEQLDQISPLIQERIHYEVQRRILEVNLTRDDFWWMGLQNQRRVNNWNPWICSNWLAGVLILEKDQNRRIQSVSKILRCLDQFLKPYPLDGGCDEGPGYWGRAAASLFDCLELLHSASEGQIDIYDEPLIRNMGSYIYRVQIADDYFINFADARAKFTPTATLVYQFGEKIDDPVMQKFGAYLAQSENIMQSSLTEIFGKFPSMTRVLAGLFNLEALVKTTPEQPLISDTWMPELQLMAARSRPGSSEGLYLAAKGGHNDESHNHNDVGNFIIYADGLPAIIDVGVETYTAKTFSAQRYEIWTMQSAYHNLPTINGIMQQHGAAFCATDVNYEASKQAVNFSLNLAQAYPEAAGIQSWYRTLTMERGKQIVLLDEYEMKQKPESLELTFMTWGKPEIGSKGKISIEAPGTAASEGEIGIEFNYRKLDVEVEPIAIEDKGLASVWGEKIYRLKFKMQDPAQRDQIKFIFSE